MSRLVVTCDDPPRPPLMAHNLKVHDVLMALAVESECHGIANPASDADWESFGMARLTRYDR
jgi:hypothetical protein